MNGRNTQDKCLNGVKVKKIDGSFGIIPALPLNTLILGTTGYGKSFFTKLYVKQILEKEDPYAVFFQIKPDDYTTSFLEPEDKIIAFDESLYTNKNLFKWNIIAEIRSHNKKGWDSELEEMASCFFEDYIHDSRNLVFANSAKNLFKAYINVILYLSEKNPSNRELIEDMKFKSKIDFIHFIKQYHPNKGLLRDVFEYDSDKENYVIPKKANDVFFFLGSVLDQFGGTFLSDDGQDTIHDYLKGKFGKHLFILHDIRHEDSCKGIEKYFLKKLGNEMLSISREFVGDKMLWILDEIDKVGRDFGLMKSITLGRGYGLQVIVTTQSIESLYCIAPELHSEHITNASLSGFPIVVAFHPGDPYTIDVLQKFFGEEMREHMILPFSRYDRPVVHAEMRPIVENNEFSSLGIGECYIKIQSKNPERVKIL